MPLAQVQGGASPAKKKELGCNQPHPLAMKKKKGALFKGRLLTQTTNWTILLHIV
jgi:hypothetical protein